MRNLKICLKCNISFLEDYLYENQVPSAKFRLLRMGKMEVVQALYLMASERIKLLTKTISLYSSQSTKMCTFGLLLKTFTELHQSLLMGKPI